MPDLLTNHSCITAIIYLPGLTSVRNSKVLELAVNAL